MSIINAKFRYIWEEGELETFSISPKASSSIERRAYALYEGVAKGANAIGPNYEPGYEPLRKFEKTPLNTKTTGYALVTVYVGK